MDLGSHRSSLPLLAVALLALGCGNGTDGPNGCTSSARCPPPTDAGVYVCVGFCDGKLGQTAQLLADGGIGTEESDGGVVSECPSGHVTGAQCALLP